MTQLNAEESVTDIANAVREAADRLENLADKADRVKSVLESESWTIDRVQAARSRIDAAKDALLKAATDIGMAHIVQEAYARNKHVGNKSTVAG